MAGDGGHSADWAGAGRLDINAGSGCFLEFFQQAQACPDHFACGLISPCAEESANHFLEVRRQRNIKSRTCHLGHPAMSIFAKLTT
jgi:hypothetical protein